MAAGRSARRAPRASARGCERLDKLTSVARVFEAMRLVPHRAPRLDPPAMHPWLAFLCFFRILFGKPAAGGGRAKFLPEGAAPPKAPPETPARRRSSSAWSRRSSRSRAKAALAQHHRDGALALLALLQREGRFVDFLRDSVDGARTPTSARPRARSIAAAARCSISTCRFEPVMPGAEEEKVSVPKGFDPAEIRLIGEAKGEPPFRGTLRHHGWRVVDAKLPTLAEGVDRTVIAPAEVELPA